MIGADSCSSSSHSDELEYHSRGDGMPLEGFRHRNVMLQFTILKDHLSWCVMGALSWGKKGGRVTSWVDTGHPGKRCGCLELGGSHGGRNNEASKLWLLWINLLHVSTLMQREVNH